MHATRTNIQKLTRIMLGYSLPSRDTKSDAFHSLGIDIEYEKSKSKENNIQRKLSKNLHF
jgi:hypothetical protein